MVQVPLKELSAHTKVPQDISWTTIKALNQRNNALLYNTYKAPYPPEASLKEPFSKTVFFPKRNLFPLKATGLDLLPHEAAEDALVEKVEASSEARRALAGAVPGGAIGLSYTILMPH